MTMRYFYQKVWSTLRYSIEFVGLFPARKIRSFLALFSVTGFSKRALPTNPTNVLILDCFLGFCFPGCTNDLILDFGFLFLLLSRIHQNVSNSDFFSVFQDVPMFLILAFFLVFQDIPMV